MCHSHRIKTLTQNFQMNDTVSEHITTDFTLLQYTDYFRNIHLHCICSNGHCIELHNYTAKQTSLCKVICSDKRKTQFANY